MKQQWSVGILLFEDVEVLDFAGPFEVFSVTTYPDQHVDTPESKPFVVKLVSETGELVHARNGLKVQPDYSFDNAPHFDILIVPGGYGAEEIEIHNPVVIKWIQNQFKKVELLGSVCTGALLLAQAGLLDGKRATTHWMDIDRLEKEFPAVAVQRNVKFVDEGNIVTSGGISAGINMAFHVVKRLGRKLLERQPRGWSTTSRLSKTYYRYRSMKKKIIQTEILRLEGRAMYRNFTEIGLL